MIPQEVASLAQFPISLLPESSLGPSFPTLALAREAIPKTQRRGEW
jgi:hypothetical protein